MDTGRELCLATLGLLGVAACGSQPDSLASSGAGGTSGADVASSSHTSVTHSAASSTTGSGGGAGDGGGGGMAMFSPMPDPNSFWAQTGDMYQSIDPVPMCTWQGDVLLVVNIAAL